MHKLPPNQSQKGNHYIVFKLEVPKNLTREEQILYEELAKSEEPIDPRTVRMSDEELEEATRGSGRKTSNKSGNKQNRRSKEDSEDENQEAFNLFSRMFRNKVNNN